MMVRKNLHLDVSRAIDEMLDVELRRQRLPKPHAWRHELPRCVGTIRTSRMPLPSPPAEA